MLVERLEPTRVTPEQQPSDSPPPAQQSSDSPPPDVAFQNAVDNARNGDSGVTPVNNETANTDSQSTLQLPPGQELRNGQVEYEVKPNDNLNSIAEEFGVTLEDIELSNPHLFSGSGGPGLINPGDRVVILDDTRREAARVMRDAVSEAQAAEGELDQLREQVGDQAYNQLLRGNPEIEDRANAAWAEVRELAIMDLYYAGADSRTPIDEMDGVVNDILARFPGDAEVERQLRIARGQAEEVWQSTGRTTEVQNELTRLTNDVVTARETGQGVAEAEAALTDHLTGILSDANNPDAASDPMVRLAGLMAQADASSGSNLPEEVIAQQLIADALMPPGERGVRAQALMLTAYGPEDQAFVDAVEAAQHRVLAEQPAEQIAEAYAEGGAPAAAAKLRELTGRDVASEDRAAAIMREAMPTIEQVTSDLGEFERNGAWPNIPEGAELPLEWEPTVPLNTHNGDRLPTTGVGVTIEEQVLADLSAASDYAFHGEGGDEAVADVASAILREAPEWDETGLDERLFYQAVAAGEGATLQFEIVKQLQDAGRGDEAAEMLETIAIGAEKLPDGVRSVVHEFTGFEDNEGSGQELMTLIANWRGVLSDAELNRAVSDYLRTHPDTVSDMEGDLDRIGQAGFSMVQFERAWDAYRADLQGLEHGQRINDVVGQFGNQDDAELSFARSMPPALMELTRADNTGLASDPSNIFVQPASTIRGLAKSLTAGSLYAFANIESVKPNTKPGIFMNGSGALLAGGTSALLFTQEGGPQSPTDWAYGGFFGAMTLKEGTEFGSGLAVALGRADEGGLIHRIGTADSPGWTRLSKGLAGVGAAIDFYAAANAASRGGWENWVTAGLSATSGLAGLASIAGLGGPWAPIVGAVAVGLGAGFNQWRSVQAANRYEGPTKDFLIAAGLDPEIARHLGNHDGDGVSAAARLGPLAEHLGIEPGELLTWLNQQDPEFVGEFVEGALHQVTPNDDGQYTMSDSDGDLTIMISPRGHRARVIDITDDGRVVYEFGGIERTMSAENVRLGDPSSIAGIEMWAELSGHPLPAA